MTKKDLKNMEFDKYYKRYIDKLSGDVNLVDGFKIGCKNAVNFFESIPSEKIEYRYASEKWTVKEIFQHLIDTERIFMYRCFRIARNDKTPLAGFNQEIYIEPSNANNKTTTELLEEFKAVRNNSISLLSSLTDNNLEYIGNANGSSMSARAAAFIIIGHEIWHMEIIKEKYLEL